MDPVGCLSQGAASVDRVARERQTDKGGVDPDLMHDATAHGGLPEIPSNSAEMSLSGVPLSSMRRLRASLHHHAFLSSLVMCDGGLDFVFFPRHAPITEKAVGLQKRLFFEEAPHAEECLMGLCGENNSRSGDVESMKNPSLESLGEWRVLFWTLVAESVEQAVAVGVLVERKHGESSRLHQPENLLIFRYHNRRHVLNVAGPVCFWQVD